MNPELYHGVLAAVPFVDVVTTMLDDTIPLTTGEYDEWGNPNVLEYYNYIDENNPQTFKNPQRMKRFVEVCIGTGKPYSSFLKKKTNTRNFTTIIISLEATHF